jgi:PhnB protein
MEMVIYLFFNGNCEAAMNFYAKALNGNIVSIQRYGDADMPCDEADKGKVMHGVLQTAEFMMMFSDTTGKEPAVFGTNYSLSLNFHDETSIDAAFVALAEGGTTDMPLQDTFWGAKFGMCTDKFGVRWMFNYDRPKA